jgi:hypothetical protein
MRVYLQDKSLAHVLYPHPDLPTSFDGNLNKNVRDKKTRQLLEKHAKTLMMLAVSLEDDSVFHHYGDGATVEYSEGLA